MLVHDVINSRVLTITLRTSKNESKFDAQFMVPVLIAYIHPWTQLSDVQRLHNSELKGAFGDRCKYINVLSC